MVEALVAHINDMILRVMNNNALFDLITNSLVTTKMFYSKATRFNTSTKMFLKDKLFQMDSLEERKKSWL